MRVRLFAILRDRAGVDMLELDVQETARVADAAAALAARYPALADALARVAYAVNFEYVSADQVLSEHDELAFIPPVSGG